MPGPKSKSKSKNKGNADHSKKEEVKQVVEAEQVPEPVAEIVKVVEQVPEKEVEVAKVIEAEKVPEQEPEVVKVVEQVPEQEAEVVKIEENLLKNETTAKENGHVEKTVEGKEKSGKSIIKFLTLVIASE